MKKKRKKKTKKLEKSKKIINKVKKEISKINLKKIKYFKGLNLSLKSRKKLKIDKQIKYLKGLNLLLQRKKKQIISNQINQLSKISLHRLANFTSQSLNKAYEDFKKKQKINRFVFLTIIKGYKN